MLREIDQQHSPQKEAYGSNNGIIRRGLLGARIDGLGQFLDGEYGK